MPSHCGKPGSSGNAPGRSENRALLHGVLAAVASGNNGHFTLYSVGNTLHVAFGSIGESGIVGESRSILLPAGQFFIDWLDLLQHPHLARHVAQDIALVAIPGTQGETWEGIEDI